MFLLSLLVFALPALAGLTGPDSGFGNALALRAADSAPNGPAHMLAPRGLTTTTLGARTAPQKISNGLLGNAAWAWWEIIRSFRNRNGKRASTSTKTTNFIYYTVDVELGTPVQKLSLLLDTASPDLFVLSKNCAGSDCAAQRSRLFDPKRSSTANVTTTERSLDYLFGTGTGFTGTETVSFCSGETYPKQGVLFGTNSSLGFADVGIQGVAGLSRPFENVSTPVWQQFADKKFGILLRPVDRNAPSPLSAGKLDIGGFDPRYITGSEEWVPAIPSLFWSIRIDGINVNGHEVCDVKNHIGVLSTSSNFILGHPKYVEDFYKGIKHAAKNPASGLWEWPCTQRRRWAGDGRRVVSTWRLGKTEYRLDSENLVHDVVNGRCQGTVLDDPGLNGTDVDWVLGQPFLLNVYLAFQDGPAGPRFAFNPLKQLPQTPTQPPPHSVSRRSLPAPTAVRREETFCPAPLTACAVGSDYECIDTATELSSCGGCTTQPYGNTTLVPTGVDCTALPGVVRTRLTCRHGTCVALACRRGFALVNGVCVRG